MHGAGTALYLSQEARALPEAEISSSLGAHLSACNQIQVGHSTG